MKLKLKLSQYPENENELIERYIILLLGVEDKPIPSILHLEKELFILSKFNPRMGEYIHFEKHYEGPYSPEVKELVEDPLYFSNAWIIENKRIKLNQEGKLIFRKLVEMFKDNPNFQKLLSVMKLIRKLYDRLSRDELLLLVYATYPEYKMKSKVYDRIYKKRKELALSLLKKGLITRKRYEELIR